MNNWILPDVQKELDSLKEQKAKADSERAVKAFGTDLKPNYVIIDAALWGTDIDILFLDPAVKYRSLFRGSTGEKLWSVAPYLVDISSSETFIEKMNLLIEKDPMERRVMWLSAPINIDTLRKHLRYFLKMRKEDRSYIYFRFYDPYIVNSVFPNLSNDQSSEFFEKIDYMMAYDIRSNERLLFHLPSDQRLPVNSKKRKGGWIITNEQLYNISNSMRLEFEKRAYYAISQEPECIKDISEEIVKHNIHQQTDYIIKHHITTETIALEFIKLSFLYPVMRSEKFSETLFDIFHEMENEKDKMENLIIYLKDN